MLLFSHKMSGCEQQVALLGFSCSFPRLQNCCHSSRYHICIQSRKEEEWGYAPLPCPSQHLKVCRIFSCLVVFEYAVSPPIPQNTNNQQILSTHNTPGTVPSTHFNLKLLNNSVTKVPLSFSFIDVETEALRGKTRSPGSLAPAPYTQVLCCQTSQLRHHEDWGLFSQFSALTAAFGAQDLKPLNQALLRSSILSSHGLGG